MHRDLIPGHHTSYPPPQPGMCALGWWWPSSLDLWSQRWDTMDELHCTHLPVPDWAQPHPVFQQPEPLCQNGQPGAAAVRPAAQLVCEDKLGGAEVKVLCSPPCPPCWEAPQGLATVLGSGCSPSPTPRGCDVLSLHRTGNCLRLAEQRWPRAGQEVPVALSGTWVCWWHRDPREEPGGLRHCSTLPAGPAGGTAPHPTAIPASH